MADLNQLKIRVSEAASQVVGAEVDPEWIEVANPKVGSHLALPCFRLSKELSKSPQGIAQTIANSLNVEGVAKAEVAGPYVNLWLDAQFLSNVLHESKQADLSDGQKDSTVIVEFLSPNLAKPLSIGHLRNALQGRALTRLYKNTGYNVIAINHIGDWGTVFGMWVVGFEKFSSDEQLKDGGNKELGRVYVEVRKALKEEEAAGKTDLADSVQDWLKRLEDGDQTALDYHAKFSEISLSDVTDQIARLGMAFDHNLGESFYIERGKAMVEELVASGDAIRQDDGSVIIPLDDQGIDVPFMIEKSNGAALYSTSDMAAVEYREKTWDPDLVVYVVGSEQQLHFRQLFAANKKLGWSDAELVHHWYGLIEELDEDGNRRKMSSRSKAIYMADLLLLAQERASDIAPNELSEDDVRKIAIGAITFREFAASHTGNTLFDWDAMFSLSGFSGPYVQYAAVRVNALLAKSGQTQFDLPSGYDMSPYADILWLISRYSSVVDEATTQREPHKIAEYAYELARAWNRFYESTPVLDSEGDDKQAKLWLASTLGEYLTRALYLLGIDVPSKM